MITASPGVITAGAAGGLLVALAARRLHTSGGYGLLAATAVGALTSPGLLTWLPTRTCRPIVVFNAFGRRGLAGLVPAGITALPAALAAPVCYRAGTSTGNVAFATIILSHVPDGTRGRVFSGSGLIWRQCAWPACCSTSFSDRARTSRCWAGCPHANIVTLHEVDLDAEHLIAAT